MHPRAVVVIRLASVKQIARTEFLRQPEHAALIAKRAAFHRHEVLGQRLVKFQMGRARRAEIPHVGVIRAFFVIHPLHKLRDDDVHVRVTLAMRVRRQVQRHPIQVVGEIGAVIQIEAAQEILVGLPAARVLRDDDARHGFQDFPAAQNRAVGKLRRAGGALPGGIGDAEHAVLPPGDRRFGQADGGV